MRSRYNVLFFTDISGLNFNLEAWAVEGWLRIMSYDTRSEIWVRSAKLSSSALLP